LLGLP